MIKKLSLALALLGAWLVLPTGARAQDGADKALKLWFAQPAEKWTEALPIGNGRMGAMVFGGISEERIQFNEDTLWKGFPHDYDRAGAHDHLGQIRQLLFDGKTKEAAEVTLEDLPDYDTYLDYQIGTMAKDMVEKLLAHAATF